MTPAILAPAAALGTSTKVLSFPRCHLGTKATRVYFSEESSSVAVMVAGLRTRRRSTCTRAAKTTSEDRIALQTIDDLDRDYCTDFECQSSPAVEQTVRSFARATTMLRYNQGLFQPDVQYTDGFRTFQGAAKYSNQRWYAENVQKPTVTITKMKMLNKATAQIDWRVTGAMGGGQVDIGVTSVITMNLLTGRITNHKETWDLSKVPPPAAMTATMGRMVWSLKRNAADAGEKVSNKVSESLGSMSGDDEPQIYNNPADPTKFFQGNDNSQWNDYVSYAFLAALLYFAFKAFGELEKLS